MKKIKWILLILTVLLLIVFLFATCRRTKAYSYSYNVEEPFYTQNYNCSVGGFAGIIDVNRDVSFNLLTISDGSNTWYYFVDCNYGVFRLSNFTNDLYFFDTTTYTTDLYYFQLVFDYVEEEIYFYFAPINLNLTARTNDSPIISSITLNSNGAYWALTRSDFVSNYTSSQPSIYCLLNYAYSLQSPITGLTAFFTFDIIHQFSNDIEEQTEFLFDDLKVNIPTNYYNDLIDTVYFQGYNAGYNYGYNYGYQLGYDDGYTAGETAGYNRGYNTGYNAGLADNTTAYNHGYDDGLADGYRDGVVAGYDNGYATGYSVGYNEGLEGATPVSQTVTLIGSIFGAIGTVLSIELFPGFTIGILILVPLFFAVLGLILWIWRRN